MASRSAAGFFGERHRPGGTSRHPADVLQSGAQASRLWLLQEFPENPHDNRLQQLAQKTASSVAQATWNLPNKSRIAYYRPSATIMS
jgi:hypothetical protein